MRKLKENYDIDAPEEYKNALLDNYIDQTILKEASSGNSHQLQQRNANRIVSGMSQVQRKSTQHFTNYSSSKVDLLSERRLSNK